MPSLRTPKQWRASFIPGGNLTGFLELPDGALDRAALPILRPIERGARPLIAPRPDHRDDPLEPQGDQFLTRETGSSMLSTARAPREPNLPTSLAQASRSSPFLVGRR